MPVSVIRYTIYHSPNAYLGAVLADERLARLPATLERRPIFVPRSRGTLIADLVGGRETQRHGGYHREDCRRWAKRHGVELNFTPPGEFHERAKRWAVSEFEREELPARTYYAAEGTGREGALDRALFEEAFVNVRDVNEEDVVRDACRTAGLDPDEILARARSEEMKQRLEASLAAFDSAACPGVPVWIVEGERFWGKDRAEWMVETVADLCRG